MFIANWARLLGTPVYLIEKEKGELEGLDYT